MDIHTQQKRILDYCNANGSITVRDAFDILHINSPTKRLSEMRHNPKYQVDTQTVNVYDDDGKYRSRYTRYWVREAS